MVVAMGELYSDDSLDFGVDSSEDTEDASETGMLPYKLCFLSNITLFHTKDS